jgi:hypothetical protein
MRKNSYYGPRDVKKRADFQDWVLKDMGLGMRQGEDWT